MLPLLMLAAIAAAQETPEVVDPLATRPEIATTVNYVAPVPEVFTLDNGARVWLIERPQLPLISLRLIVQGGSSQDPADHPGMVSLADTMLLRGAGDLDSVAFAEQAERLGIDLDVNTRKRDTVLSLDLQADKLDAGLGLLATAVLEPSFDKAEVARTTEQRKGALAQALDEPAVVAARIADRSYYGPGHPLAHAPAGSAWGLDGLKHKQLRKSWQARSGADRATFVVSGAVDKDTLTALLNQHFGDWGAAGGELAPVPAVSGVADGPLRIMVNNPDSSQTILRVILPGWAASDPQRVSGSMGTIVLGGTFTSRLNRLLREEKGYTYGARAQVRPSAGHGVTIASTAVKRDVTGPALADLLAELRRISDGVDAAEVAKAVGANQTRIVSSMGSRAGIAGTFTDLVVEGLGPDGLQTDLASARDQTPEGVTEALKRLDLDHAVIVVVGDLEKIRPAVEEVAPGTWTVVGKDPR